MCSVSPLHTEGMRNTLKYKEKKCHRCTLKGKNIAFAIPRATHDAVSEHEECKKGGVKTQGAAILPEAVPPGSRVLPALLDGAAKAAQSHRPTVCGQRCARPRLSQLPAALFSFNGERLCPRVPA